MQRCIPLILLALGACSFHSGLPELPARNDLPLNSEVDLAYEEVIASPNDAEANGKLGMILHRLDNYGSAEMLYHRAFLLDPEAFRWIYYIAETQASEDKYDAAVATLRHALSKDPSYLPAKLRLAELAFRMGNMVESGQIYRELAGKERLAAIANYRLGRIEARQGHPEKAAGFYRRACEGFPEYGPAQFALGFAVSQLGDKAVAREHFILADKYKMLEPRIDDPLLAAVRGKQTRASGYLREGYELELKGKAGEAGRAYEEALRIDSRAAEAHARLIRIRGEEGKRAEAEAHYKNAIALDADQADAYSNYGLLLLGQKRYQEARTSFDRALAINPYHPEALVHLGYLLETGRQSRAAERNYRLAIECKPEYREAHLRLGSLLVQRGRYGEAVKEFDAVLGARDEKTPGFLCQIATQLDYAGDHAKAGEYLEKARRLATEYGQMKLLDEIDKQSRTFR